MQEVTTKKFPYMDLYFSWNDDEKLDFKLHQKLNHNWNTSTKKVKMWNQPSKNPQKEYHVRVSNLWLPKHDYFDQISNDITYVNSFLLLLPTLNFELKIRNHHCAPNIIS